MSDLEVLKVAGVDCVGLNFVPASKRCLSLGDGEALSDRAEELGLTRALVVMNATQDELNELLSWVDLDYLQLHGDERPEDVDELPAGVRIIKAISWSGRAEEIALAEAWRDDPRLAAFLVDAYAPGVGGGTGRVARWDLLLPRPEVLSSVPLILAGGISGENVADAIAATHADGVDTASGVENSPGIKNAERVDDFARNAAAAF